MNDFTLVISAGSHDSPEEGACVMEYVSVLAGERFSDRSTCTHPVLAAAAIGVNDRLSDADRHLMVPLIGRLFGTAPTGTDAERKVVSVRLAVWCARRVAHLVPPQDRPVCAAAVDAAEAWANDPTWATAAAAAAAYANAAYAAAYAAANAHPAASAATNATAAATSAANADYATSAAAAANAAAAAYADAVYAAVYADAVYTAHTASVALVAFLSGLLDEHSRLTGHVSYVLTPTDKALLTNATKHQEQQ